MQFHMFSKLKIHSITFLMSYSSLIITCITLVDENRQVKEVLLYFFLSLKPCRSMKEIAEIFEGKNKTSCLGKKTIF